MLEPQRLTTLWAFTACYRDSFTFLPPRLPQPIHWLAIAAGCWSITLCCCRPVSHCNRMLKYECMSWFCPAFWWWESNIYLVFSVFTSRPISLLAPIKVCVEVIIEMGSGNVNLIELAQNNTCCWLLVPYRFYIVKGRLRLLSTEMSCHIVLEISGSCETSLHI
jgi:hypothetical protein